jgi:hypothetical protein
MPYNRVQNMVSELKNAVTAVENYYTDNNLAKTEGFTAAIKAINTAADEFNAVSEGESFSTTMGNVGTAMSDLGSGVTGFLTAIGDTTSDALTTPLAVLKKAVQFTSTDQYANFYVRTVATEGTDAKSSELAGAGSVNINSINNSSQVLIGKNAAVTATGTLNTAANTVGKTVSFTGNASAFLLPNSANAAGIGASVAVENFSGDSLMVVAEGAKLSGAAVNITADNDLNRTGVVYSAGTAGTTGLSGMVDVMVGDSNAITLVDDEAIVNASATGTTVGKNNGSVNITASNDTVLTNIAGGLMKSGTTAIGAGAAVTSYDVQTIAGIIDTDANVDTTSKEDAQTARDKSDNKIKAAQASVQAAMSDADKTLLGTTATPLMDGSITGQKVIVNATANGVINSVGVAGAVTTSDDSGEPGFIDKVSGFFGKAADTLTKPVNDVITKLDDTVSGKINSKTGYTMDKAVNSGSKDQGASGTNSIVTDSTSSSSTASKAQVSAAGSVAVNILDGQTAVLTDNAHITLKPDSSAQTSGTLETSASDDIFSGAWAGGAAINWVTATTTNSSSVSVGGAAAVNVNERDVASILRKSTITNAGVINNTATKSGAEVAAALGLALSKASGSQACTNVAVGAAVSYNRSESDVHALLIDDAVSSNNNSAAAVTNAAYDNDLQVTGGINAALAIGGKSGAGVGGSIVIGQIENDIEGGIYGGAYTDVQSVDTHGVIGTKQIGAGAGIAASTSSKGAAFEGVGVYNSIDNTVKGTIDGSTITASGTVSAEAYDTADSANTHAQYITKRGLDADGASYRETINNSTESSDSDQQYNKALTDSTQKTSKDGGNIIVTGALSVAGSAGNAGVGAAVAIDDIQNTMTSSISGATITANEVSGTADTDTVLVGVSAGAAGSGKFGGAGSVSWQQVENAAVTRVQGSTITTPKADFTATNDMVGVNVAGQISAGKAAAGLALAYHDLDNTTGVYVDDSKFYANDKGIGTDLSLAAASNAKIFSVAAGVAAVTGTIGLNGTIAINRGANTTEAVIDKSTVTDAKTVSADASDDTVTTAIAGGVTAGSGTAVGAAIALNDIGGFSADGTKSSQNIKAQIKNTDITTIDSGALVHTNATDNAHMVTVGVGIGASSQSAIQGSSATSLINKSVQSGLENTTINKDTADSGAAKLEATASNDAKIIANATVVAAGSSAGVGAGVGVNRIVQTTEAAVSGGTQNVQNALIQATGTPTIIATGVGGAGAGTASVAGSFGVNIIDNTVKASIFNQAVMNSQGNIGVVAQSDEAIGNYAGVISGAGTAAVGLATAVNTISGSTEATIEDSTVSAKGSDTDQIMTASTVKDGAIISDVADTASFTTAGLKKDRQSEGHTGLVVDSSATHSISSILATAGGSGGAAVMGAVNVNHIGGSTTAKVSNTDINTNLDDLSKADVVVKASDYTNSAGLVGAAAGSMYAAVGAVSDTNLVNRTTEAIVTGNNTVKAHDFKVNAVSVQGLSNFDLNAAVAVEGGGVGGTVTVDKLESTTNASVENMDVTYTHAAETTANHSDGAYVANVSAAGAAIGAGVGLTVGVVHQESNVAAAVTNSTISSGDSKDTTATVKAENTSNLGTLITSAGIGAVGAGVAGTTAVNNMKQNVSTTVTGSTIQAGSVDVSAVNTTNVSANGGSMAGGAGGVGVSVTVNTFDDTVNTTVANSTLQSLSEDVKVSAEENRDVEQIVANVAAGGVAAGANVMVTNVNTSVDNEDAQKAIVEANSANKDQSTHMIGLTAAEQQQVSNNTSTEAGTGGNDTRAGVHVMATNATISAMGTVNVSASEKNDVSMHGGSVTAGEASLNAAVGILNVKHDTNTILTNGSVTGKKVVVSANQGNQKDGTALNLYQGTAGGFALGAAYGSVTTAGTSKAVINGTTLRGGDIDVAASDTSSAAINAYAVSAGVTAAGALVATAENDSDVAVIVDNATMEADKIDDKTDSKGKITLTADKNNAVSAKAVQVTGGLVGGSGMYAGITDNGSSNLTIGTKNALQATEIDATAKNTPTLTAQIDSASGGVLAAGSVNVATINVGEQDNPLQTVLTIGKGNQFAADVIGFSASANVKQTADMLALSIGSYADAIGNLMTADTYSKVDITADADNTYTGSVLSWDTQGLPLSYGKTDISFEASNTAIQDVTTKGIGAAGYFATGTNISTTQADLTTQVELDGSRENSSIDDLKAQAGSYAGISNAVNGDGGAIADISPYAAKANNTYNATTDVTMKGNWTTAGKVSASALNDMDIDVDANAVRAAVVGGSGVWLRNTINNTADVILDGAVINSAGAQSYMAQNNVMYTGTIDASGYGGLNINAADLQDNITFTAGVNAKNKAILNGTGDTGSVSMEALTTGTINSTNDLKSAGVIPVSLAFSKHDVTYDNTVTVDGNSQITTAKKDQDITLAATDETKVTLKTIADTQGGAVGAASAEATSILKRNNAVRITSGSMTSMNDVNLYAGADLEGISSSLDYNVTADAYNKTVLPLYTSPKVNNTMEQKNQVVVNGTVNSVRNSNLKAGKGLTTVTESAREYNVYTGTSGSGSVTSTASGEHNSNESTNNFVQIDHNGAVTAGIHNNLDVTISGSTIVNEDKTDVNKSSIDYKNIKVTVNKEDTWFDPTSITTGTVEIKNSLINRYNELNKLLSQYDSQSNEYAIFKSEMDGIRTQMKDNGFISGDSSTSGIILESVTLPAISLPDIVVSGGNINIDTDAVSSGDVTGKLTAQGVNNLTITNKSDLYLKVNDLVIKDKGGYINVNDVSLGKGEKITGFAGTVSSSAANEETPEITVQSTGTSLNGLTRPDIGVFGTIQNTNGDARIENTKYNINVDGNAKISTRNTVLKSDGGSVTQNSKGLLLVGGDPVTKYQFSDAVAKKIQRYISNAKEKGTDISWLTSVSSYEAYKAALLKKESNGAYTLGFNDSEAASINDYKFDESGGILAQNNVYISGRNVNIDGLVQSGYQNYAATLDDKALSKVTELDLKHVSDQTALSNQTVMSDDTYCINDGGAVYNSTTGVWDYVVRVYYNPSTKELLSESIEPSGGKIYITGAISSTGSGRIRAMDGTPDITIDTSKVDRDLRVNTIASNDIAGFISIKDTQKNILTEYETDGTKMTVKTTPFSSDADKTTQIITGSSTTYAPATGMSLSWSGGTSGDKTVETWQYSKKFIGWGLIRYGTTEDFVANSEVSDGKTMSSSSTIPSDKGLDRGTVISVSNPAAEYSVTTGVYKDTTHATYSEVDVDKDYDGFWGKVFGYGKAYYTWDVTTGTSTSSTYTIKADKAIDVGFMNGGSGDISVTSNQNMFLAGNISSATSSAQTGIGKVSLVSQNGAITAVGDANINADNLNISAATGISVNHASIGSDASIAMSSAKGDVVLNSQKGDLTFTGTIAGSQAEGNLEVKAAGDIHTAADTALKGNRIDLTSGGAIQALVTPATELISADTLSASVNATAQGNITLENKNGDMRIGHIESQNGDVVLTTSGSFVDAAGDATLSDSESKVDKWIELGLISKDDADDVSTKAAAESKAIRLEALDAQAKQLANNSAHEVIDYTTMAAQYQKYTESEEMVQAKAAYVSAVKANKGDDTAIQQAYKAYQEKQQSFFAEKGFSTDEQNLIVSYAEISNSDAYGWSKNNLLYAIQDSVLNSVRGEVLTVDTPNIKGNNISLSAAKNIGVDGAAQTIAYTNLSQIDNLKILAQAKGGDLTWNDADQTVEIRQQKPLTLQIADGGKLALHANTSGMPDTGSIYLAGVKNSVLDITGSINTTEDVKLMSDNGVVMNEGSLVADNLIITGGKGDIGSVTHAINTNISGVLDANTIANIYIHQQAVGTDPAKVLTIQSMTGHNIWLSADAGMKMTTETGKTAGYINSDLLTLAASDGNIGVDGDGIRILNNGAVVNAEAQQGNVYLTGKEAGTLVLGKVKASNDFVLRSEGSADQGQNELKDESGNVTAQKIVSTVQTNGNTTIDADGNINLVNGTIQVGDDKNLTLKAVTGAVIQSAQHSITADNTDVTAKTGIALNSGAELKENPIYNVFKNMQVKNSSNNIILGNGGGKDWTVAVENGTTAADVTIHNYDADADNNLIIKGDINATGNVTVLNDEAGNIITNDATNAEGFVNINAIGSITNIGSVQSGEDTTMTAGQSITNKGSVTSRKAATMTAGQDIVNDGTVQAVNAVTMNAAKGSITNNNSVTSSDSSVTMTANTGILTKGNIAAKADVIGTTNSGAIEVDGTVKADEGKVDFVNKNGSIVLNGAVEATKGLVHADANNGSVTLGGNVLGGTTVTANATEGDVNVKGNITSNGGDTTLTATDSNNSADAGNINVSGAITSAAQAVMNATNGNIDVSGDVTGKSHVLAATKGTGDITLNGNVISKEADVKAATETGNINVAKLVNAHHDAMFQSTVQGGINLGGDVAAGNDLDAQTNTGNIGFNGTAAAGRNLTARTAKKGNITFDGAVTAENDFVADAVQTGGITLHKDITAGRDMTMHTNDGTILFEGNDGNATEDIVAKAKNGDVNITVTGTGDVKDTHRTINGDRGFVRADKGNVTIDHQGTGMVDLYEVFAKENARIAVKDGDLYLNKVDGNLVALIVRNPDKTMKVDHITAGTEIGLSGSDIGIEDISQRPDSEGLLVITPNGSSDDMPINKLHIGDIRTNSGVRFKHLWLNNGDVSVSKGKFYLDKLYILGKGTFSNGVMTTNVFGTAPIPDEPITSTYWNNTGINNPKNDMAGWFQDGQNSKWMYLRFPGQGNVQFSNGNLLSLLPHNHVYSERYTQETWSRIFEDRDYYNFYDRYYNPGVSYHERYGLMDIPDSTVSNASPKDIVVK